MQMGGCPQPVLAGIPSTSFPRTFNSTFGGMSSICHLCSLLSLSVTSLRKAGSWSLASHPSRTIPGSRPLASCILNTHLVLHWTAGCSDKDSSFFLGPPVALFYEATAEYLIPTFETKKPRRCLHHPPSTFFYHLKAPEIHEDFAS